MYEFFLEIGQGVKGQGRGAIQIEQPSCVHSFWRGRGIGAFGVHSSISRNALRIQRLLLVIELAHGDQWTDGHTESTQVHFLGSYQSQKCI